MFNRKSYLVMSVLAISVFVSSVVASPSMVSWWHGLSQSQRNAEILDVAFDQVGDYTGLQCKTWVQEVVDEASDGSVYIPSNSNNYTWNINSNIHVLLRPYPIESIQPGQIIQMQWRNHDGSVHAHTAIVRSRTGVKMTWIDCNWSGNGKVTMHDVYFSDFYTATSGYNYNIYEIR